MKIGYFGHVRVRRMADFLSPKVNIQLDKIAKRTISVLWDSSKGI